MLEKTNKIIRRQEKNEKKVKVIALGMSAIMLLSASAGNGTESKVAAMTETQPRCSRVNAEYKKQPISINNKKESYIVVTKSENKVEVLSDSYTNDSVSEYSNLANENMVSLSITGKEADTIQKQKDVLCVERDVEVAGCASVVAYTYASLNKDATYRICKLGNYMEASGESSESYLTMYYDVTVN